MPKNVKFKHHAQRFGAPPRILIDSVYQPIVEIESKEIFGYEALARSRKGGNPQDLFRRAYEQGHAIALDLKCIRSAFRSFKVKTNNRFLFVNVEPITLGHSFRKGRRVEGLLKKMNSHSHQVVFELTEGMKARDFDLVKQGYMFLRDLGFKFAIDDVDGIDSKLFKLLALKPDLIKVDMGLIQGISHNVFQQNLVKQLVELGWENDFQIIAEGIEHKNDLDYVTKLGIPYAQGYYFAKPNPVIHKQISAYQSSK